MMLKVVGGTDFTPKTTVEYFDEQSRIDAEREELLAKMRELEEQQKLLDMEKKLSPKLKLDGGEKIHVDNTRTRRFVDPIRSIDDIQKIIGYFESHIQLASTETKRKRWMNDMMYFIIGIYSGFRRSDLVSMKWKDLIDSSTGKCHKVYAIKEQKTGKVREFWLNKEMVEIIESYIDVYPLENYNHYVFSKTGEKPYEQSRYHKMMKNIQKDCGIEGNLSTHSVRKTFAYQVYSHDLNSDDKFTQQMALGRVQCLLKHSSSETTLRYLGITQESLKDTINDLHLTERRVDLFR